MSGIVLYKGKPVEGASVALVPVDPKGRSAAGVTDAHGNFSVTTYLDPTHQPAGALVGEYRITVAKEEPFVVPAGMTGGELLRYRLSQPPPKHLLPVAYGQPEKSGFEITIGKSAPEPLKLELN